MKPIFRLKPFIVLSFAVIILLWIFGQKMEVALGQTPLREPLTGTCECPYDRTSAGRLCGGNSSYSRAGGDSKPACYGQESVSPTQSPTPASTPTSTPTSTETQPPETTSSVHLTFGNPSAATSQIENSDNYLLIKPQYALSYNRSKGIPNWVSWQLNPSWLGDVPRQDDFRPDSSLPTGWYRVTPNDYTNSGFDRGHMIPSEDRGAKVEDNSATFLMTNILPQSPDNNRGPWVQLESYCRELVKQGKELYIVAGGLDAGGTGEKGTMSAIAGKVAVPENTWKTILVLDRPGGQVSETSRTLAVIIPNNQGIRLAKWQQFRVSVDEVEQRTGYDFFSNVPVEIQAAIESKVDSL
jgi:endonuclease G, mitochondrial